MNFFDLIPSFLSGVTALHDELVAVTLILCFAGLLVHCVYALLSQKVAHVYPTLIRMTIICVLVTGLSTWTNLLVQATEGLKQDMGTAGGFDIFQAYQAAIARKMGTAAATNNFSQGQRPAPTIASNFTGGNGAGTGNVSGVTLTHYAYAGDSTGDSKSSQGIGAFSWDSAPGSLIPGYSAALSNSVAQQYGVQPGQSFTITSAGGQTYNLVYADVVPDSYTNPNTGQVTPIGPRIDIYDPNNQLGSGDNFSQNITGINGGPVVMGQTGLASMLPSPGGDIKAQILWAFTLFLSWVASGIMWIMIQVQKVLYYIEVAISPIFIGFLMIPALTHLARRFFLGLVALILWPLAWGVCNLISRAMIDIAVNPTNNAGLGLGTLGALVSGPLAGLAFMIVVACWVIGSTFAAPLMVSWWLDVRGGAATAAVFGATLGALAANAAGTANAAAGSPLGIAKGAADVVNRSALINRALGGSQSYARRPTSSQTGKET